MSSGHSSSAYSFEVVWPSSSEIAAATMIAFHSHRWRRDSEVREQAHAAQALHGVVAAREHDAEREAEDHGVRVDRADAPEVQVGRHVQLRPGELERRQQAHAHADDAPEQAESAKPRTIAMS